MTWKCVIVFWLLYILQQVKTDNDIKEISPAQVILAAGAQSGEVGKLAQIGVGPGILKTAIPVEPR